MRSRKKSFSNCLYSPARSPSLRGRRVLTQYSSIPTFQHSNCERSELSSQKKGIGPTPFALSLKRFSAISAYSAVNHLAAFLRPKTLRSPPTVLWPLLFPGNYLSCPAHRAILPGPDPSHHFSNGPGQDDKEQSDSGAFFQPRRSTQR